MNVTMSNTSILSSSITPTTTSQTKIQIVTIHMNIYGSIIILIVGIIGCLCNLLTFTSRQLRQNSCAFYFLCSTIFELLSIIFGLSSRLAADFSGSNLQHRNRYYCKFRAYFVSAIPLIATYLVLLSAIDRCMSSSMHARFRLFSRMKIAYRSVAIAILISLVSCSHILISYNLRPKCATLPGAYTVFDSLFVILWLGVIPHILMLIFGFITLINIKQSRLRRTSKLQGKVIHSNQNQRSSDQKTEAQLILMMLVQVGLSSLLILTRMIYYAYYILGPPLTGYDRMIGSFLMSFTILLYYANYAKSFYIYTLTSQLFRSVFIRRMKGCIQKIIDFNNSVMVVDKTVTIAN